MSENTVSVKVCHLDPVKGQYSQWNLKFWLSMTVDNGCRVATGESQPVIVQITKPSIEEARRAAFAIERVAQESVKGQDFTEAMLAFPQMIRDLANQEEPK